MAGTKFRQEPIAVVGFAGRLPGGNHNPQQLWDFLERGGIADNTVPASRFNVAGHYDGSHKPGTMRPKGGMFLGDIDLADFDASFFGISGTEAIAMDPNQRQMLEVVYEALENAGMTLERLDGSPVACYVASYASDYGDIQNRDAEDRPANCSIGVGRAIMANRLSYFLNIKGPSITIDTACSGSLVGLDLAARALQSGEVDAAIVAASSLYLNPDHVMDAGNVGQAHSPSALCHTFDIDADGYVKAESVNAIIVKRVSDAIRDGDPIRAIVLGTASNSNGRTQGIASPSAADQANAVRQAYANAGITDLNATAYIECHGTGTNAGDPQEVGGIASVFSKTRDPERPLVIGSIKSNVGHAEPAAAINGLMKAIMSIEKGVIPGCPTFIKPNPKIDFIGNKVKASRTAIPWPDQGYAIRRASINSFGYGGSNAHAIIEQPKEAARENHVFSSRSGADDFDLLDDDDEESDRPCILVLSANDPASLKENIAALSNHIINPRTRVNLHDLAYTLNERRSHLWHRAYLTTATTEIKEKDFTLAKKLSGESLKIGFVFTGQGSQWPQMGSDLLKYFPWTRSILEELDTALHDMVDAPSWSIVEEISQARSAEHMRKPEFSQTLVTALQLCILAVLESWGVRPSSVVGHSSGEIAAAYAAGFLDRASAVKAAYYRGRAAENRKAEAETDVGMLAVGLGAEGVQPFLDKHVNNVWIACFNSPSSVTISGRKSSLEKLAEDIKATGGFARLLQVDLAYHSELMGPIGVEYGDLLATDKSFRPLTGNAQVAMFSSVTGEEKDDTADGEYWKNNMLSPVRFSETLSKLVTTSAPNMLIEIGPSGALAGPVSQVLKSLPSGSDVTYAAAWSRGANAGKSLFDIAGRLYVTGMPINLSAVNDYSASKPKVIVDLPNYKWNHSVKYWHESAASKDWRYRQFVHHDLLGSKIPGTSWEAPTWRKHLKLDDLTWLRDHKMGPDILVPGAGLATLGLEAMFQKHVATHPDEGITSANELAYRFRNVRFERAVVVEEGKPTTILLTLSQVPGSKWWHEFRIRTTANDVTYEHCHGLVRVQPPVGEEESLKGEELAPLKNPQSAKLWYKAQREVGMGFGPSFQLIKSVESVSGRRNCRTIVSLEPPKSKWEPQSYYPLHPAVLDNCLQTATFANAVGERSLVSGVMIPALVDDLVINKMPRSNVEGLSVAESLYTGRGRPELPKNWTANVAIHDPQTGALVMRCTGLHYVRLDVEEKPDLHTFHAVTWKPDVSILTQDQLSYLPSDDPEASRVDSIINLVAYKTPALKVLEVSLDQSDDRSLWFQKGDSTLRAAYSQYDFITSNPKILISAQSAHESKKGTAFHLLAPEREGLGLPTVAPIYDLVIVKASRHSVSTSVNEFAKCLKPLLKPTALTLVVKPKGRLVSQLAALAAKNVGTAEVALKGTRTKPASSLDAESSESSGAETDETNLITPSSTPPSSTQGSKFYVWKESQVRQLPHSENAAFSGIMELPKSSDADFAFLLPTVTEAAAASKVPTKLVVARVGQDAPFVAPSLHAMLQMYGWTISTTSLQGLARSGRVDESSVVLVLDELLTPVLTDIVEEEWEALKQVASSGSPLLWVTKGAQTERVTDPNNAMVQGLFRTIRRENPVANLTVLDVQSAASAATGWALGEILRKIQAGVEVETEYAERDGLLLIQRLMPDTPVNAFKEAEGGKGLEPAEQNLHESEALVRLQAEKLGTLNSLTWTETAVGEVPVEDGWIEIEIRASGVNFKDVAVTMGIIPENEYTIGCECAGYVKRVGAGVTKHQVGDRVAAQISGTYANRVQCPELRAHQIPDWMSYEDAATIPLVYLTAIYGMYHLGHMKEGQSILIHSAAGGVGLAAIQLAKYKKAEIYVTVGTEDKRAYLEAHYGIPRSRMFSSRNGKFADEIRKATNGKGCDIILNSLVGELLDESWRLTADGGVMIEIGKRDIVDRNTLAMEPFERNCAYRGLDLAYTKEISNELIGRLLDEIFGLVKEGHLKPIRPITVYPQDKVISALSYIRSGQHMGKIVVTSGDTEDIQLPIRPAIRKLALPADAAYLIVGGVKGLCGSIAVHLARHGARSITVISRSGTDDPASARIIENCNAHGCEVVDAKGDVADLEFVKKVFKDARPRRIAGVIQGAMVLRDRPYETMTHDDFHTAIHAKVAGTWNLHLAAQQVQKRPLDFFTLLSSLSGIVGNKGQANYAAANTFLDAFASYRQQLGLAANSVDLGAIEDVGYIAEQGNALEARFDKGQWTGINENVLRKIVTYSILQQEPNAALNAESSAQLITGLAYPLKSDGSDLTEERRYGFLFNRNANSETADGSEGDGNQIDQGVKAFGVLQASGADTATLIKTSVTLLQAQVSKVLRLETELEPGKPLTSYGLDSLSAVELRGWVRAKLGAELSTLDITNASSLVALCEKLVSKLPQPEAK